ncbi:MAG: YegS/Rv2252/BmrU family lipid kinase [Lachnospiraceae bacterium]|nr:YegS/Rv2252/BmrU family lipid kinase [Lachnospiraceae bacterium]
MKKLLLVYNPTSGKGAMKSRLSDIVNLYTGAGFICTVIASQYAGHITKVIEHLATDFDRLIVSGGDGTLNEAVTALLSIPQEKRPKLGYIPSGSTNDYARTLHLPKSLLGAASRTKEDRELVVDVGRLNDKPFVYVACFGAFTEVTYSTPQEMKNTIGHSAYIIEAIKSLPGIKPKRLKVRLSDGSEVSGEFLFGMISNASSVAGFKDLAGKHVVLNDGLFEMTLIRKPKSPVEYNEIVWAMLSKSESDKIIRAKVSSVTILSDQQVDWVVDGEYAGSLTRADITVEHKAMHILV